MKKVIICLMLLICFAPVALAEADLIIVNSGNWEDVYSGLLYATLVEKNVVFFYDSSQANLILNNIPRSVKEVLLLESSSKVFPNTLRILTNNGLTVDHRESEDLSFELWEEVPTTEVIFVDKKYPSNALAVAPYASSTSKWVFFVDDEQSFSLSKSPSSSIVVGKIPVEIFSSYSPSLVIDEGNQYRNNVQIVDLFLEEKSTKQLFISQGTFIESDFFEGVYPVLPIGVLSAPRVIEEYLSTSEFTHAVIIGQNSIPAASNLKNILEGEYDKDLKMLAKLAQTSPDPDNPTDLLPLATFPVPVPSLKININTLEYNEITGQLELRITNNGDLPLALLPSITLLVNGQTVVLESSEEFYELERLESITVQFPLDLERSDEVGATVSVIYGESVDSFDFSSTKDFEDISFVRVADISSIRVEQVAYDFDKKLFVVLLENNGSVTAYVDVALRDVLISGVPQTFSSARIAAVPPGETVPVLLPAVLSDLDFLSNPLVNYEIDYGQRQYALLKELSGSAPLDDAASFIDLLLRPGVLIPALAIIIFTTLIILIFRKKSEYACTHCGHVHQGKPKRCLSCGFGRFKKR